MHLQVFWPFLHMRKISIISTSYPKFFVAVVIWYISSCKAIETVAIWGLLSWFFAIFYCTRRKRQERLAAILTMTQDSETLVTCMIEYLHDRKAYTAVLATFLCTCVETALSVLPVQSIFDVLMISQRSVVFRLYFTVHAQKQHQIWHSGRLPYVVNCDKFFGNWLRDFDSVRAQILPCPIDLGRRR